LHTSKVAVRHRFGVDSSSGRRRGSAPTRQTLAVIKLRTSASAAALLVAALIASACSSGHGGSNGTIFGGTTPVVTSTTVVTPATPVPTTDAPTTEALTTVAPTTIAVATLPPTTSIEAPTTTTRPIGASLPLRFDGLGDARFGAEPADVIAAISDVLGKPTADSNWVVASQIGCPGSEARTVFWDDLKLTFGDVSNSSTGRRHFFTWSFGPPAGAAPKPAGMATVLGVTIGTSVTQIKKLYPAAKLIVGNDTVTPSAQLSDGLFVYLTDTTRSGVVTAVLGGQACSA
jgi:hypothetical protein